MATKIEDIAITPVTDVKGFGIGAQNRATTVSIEGTEFAYIPLNGEYADICKRCGGVGRLYGVRRDGGTCYGCHGGGLIALKDGSEAGVKRTARTRHLAKIRRDAKAQQAAESRRQANIAWLATQPRFAGIRAEVLADEASTVFNPKLRELCMRAGWDVLTDKQTAFALDMYDADINAAARKAQQAAATAWLGEVGQQITITGVVIWREQYENKFRAGYYTVMMIKDEQGNVAKWNRSGWHNPEKGSQITVTATVKALEETAEHGKSTIITRGKVQ